MISWHPHLGSMEGMGAISLRWPPWNECGRATHGLVAPGFADDLIEDVGGDWHTFAIVFEEWLPEGRVRDYAELAKQKARRDGWPGWTVA